MNLGCYGNEGGFLTSTGTQSSMSNKQVNKVLSAILLPSEIAVLHTEVHITRLNLSIREMAWLTFIQRQQQHNL